MCLFRCVRYGEARKRGKGIRSTQHHFALKCSAELYISYNHSVKKFTVQRCNLNHSHPIGAHIIPHYPSVRRLDGDELKRSQNVVSMGPKLKLVRQYILGKQVVLKDLQTFELKLTSKGKRDEAQITIDRLEEEIQSDKGSKGGVIVNEANELSIFYFASSHLLHLYEKFPEVVMIDGTYNVNASRMPLYSFMIEDGNGHGRTVFYAATTNESAQHLSAIIQGFKQCHPRYSNTKVVIIDKDFTELSILREELPNTTILFCQFHVIKCFYKAVSDLEVPKERRDT
ncbi:zinc finger SWIM domain-containing protein 3-like [Dysidea avara]|uniref:zinc finger SWIM domain-containing protein 3-like n=1 Tax=Dysidea avara TaxID=196820 RepID=UPI00331886F5